MQFLTNIHNPKDKNAKLYLSNSSDKTPEQAWAHHLEWLKDKIIGEPEATKFYAAAQLKEMGIVGIYNT